MKKRLLPLVFLFLAGISACSLFKSSSPDYIFLLTLDTTRGDAVDYSLSNNTTTPHLAGLAAEGIQFKNAYSLIPITLPSHFSIFYSLPPHLLKIYNNGQVKSLSYPSLAQILKKKGYQTGAVVSLGVLKRDFGLDKGYDEYLENFKPYLWYKNAGEVNRDAFALIDRMKGKKSFFWLHYSDPHEPYYPPMFEGHFNVYFNNARLFTCQSIEQPLVNLFMNLKPGRNILRLETEIPPAIRETKRVKIRYFTYQDFSVKSADSLKGVDISLPRKWQKVEVKHKTNYFSKTRKSRIILINRDRHEKRVTLSFMFRMLEHPASRKYLYGRQVSYMDQKIGELLNFLKKIDIYRKSLFVVMGDHGEGLGEYRDHFGHIHYLNKVYSHVPLFLAGPGIDGEGTRKEPVTNLDIAPTILDILDIEKPGFMLGRSIRKAVKPEKILLETYSPEAYFDAFSILEYPYQVIFYPGRKEERIELIHLEKDRFGVKNIFGTTENRKVKSSLYNAVLKVSRVLIATKGKVGKISKRHREILKSLGYL